MIPQQFSMMRGNKAMVRNSEGANKDNNMRGSESSSGGDRGERSVSDREMSYRKMATNATPAWSCADHFSAWGRLSVLALQ